MPSTINPNTSSHAFIDVINIPTYKNALEIFYGKDMRSVNGGFMIRVLGYGGKRLTIFLYENRLLMMAQGHKTAIDVWLECVYPYITRLSENI
jgi:hypothetical protein